jgi:ADP-ribose pyrophosphatase YjhB (NUDIX family)
VDAHGERYARRSGAHRAVSEIRLATGLAVRDDGGGPHILLVASRYASHDRPLWTLPGGRVHDGELLTDAVVREVREETGLAAVVRDLAYVSESYDGNMHVVNATFDIEAAGTPVIPDRGDHVVAAAWVLVAEIGRYVEVDVVRTPLERYLRERARYAGFARAGITIRWPET